MSQEMFGQLRSLLQQPPSAALWGQICEALDRWPRREARDQAIPYIEGHVSRWPSHLLVAPTTWTKKLMFGQLVPGMTLVRTLQLKGKSLGPQSIKPIGRLIEKIPVQVLDLSDADLQDRTLKLLIEQPFMRNIHTLNLANNAITGKGLSALASASNCHGIEVLDLSRNRLRQHHLKSLAKEGGLPGLHTLKLSHAQLTHEDLEALIDVGLLSRLRSLSLEQCQVVGAMSWRRLFLEVDWSQLEHLNLAHTKLDQGDMNALAQATTMSKLKVLNLNHAAIGPGGMSTLMDCEHFGELTHCALRHCALTGGDMAQLSTWSLAGQLEVLDLSQNALGEEGIWALADYPADNKLRDLSLDYCGFDEGAIRCMVEQCVFGQLEALSLCGCKVDDEDMVALGQAPWLSNLRTLRMNHCGMNVKLLILLLHGEVGAKLLDVDVSDNGRALDFEDQYMSRKPQAVQLRVLKMRRFGVGHQEISLFVKMLRLPELVHWDLSQNRLSEPGAMRALVRARGMGAVSSLNVDNNQLNVGDLMLLARDRSFPQLTHLSVSGNPELRNHKALSYLQKIRQVDVIAQNM